MDIRQLRAFLVLADELHFGRTARKLFMTQPALSRAIRGLEASLGQRLFDRSTRVVALTEAGRALLQPAKDLVDASDRVAEAVGRAATGEVGSLALGFAGASSHHMVSRLVKRMADEHPGIRVTIAGSNFARNGLEKILEGELDLALGRWSVVPSGIGTRVLALEHLVLAVSRQHPLARRSQVSFAEVAAERFIMLPDHPGGVLRDTLFDLSQRVGTTPDVRQLAPDTWTVLALVAENLGVTLTLSTVRDATWFPGVTFLELEDEVAPAELSLAWRTPPSSPVVRLALEAAAAVFPEVVATERH